MTGNRLTRVVGDAFAAVGSALTETQAKISIEDIGSVMSVSQGVATVSGLAGVGAPKQTFLSVGDRVDAEIEGVGKLSVTIQEPLIG